jgi:hypothetical protein
VVFKASVEALYRSDSGLAEMLEKSPDHNNAEERELVDGLLLWVAREIGADVDAKPGFHESEDEKKQRLSDKADTLIVAMSAAASEKAMAMVRDHLSETAIWADSELPLMEWCERHARLGAALQNAINDNNLCLPKVSREIASGDVAVWSNEPGFPRVIISQSGKKLA